ncbi:4-hydroxy-tetrahydrodipicolinate reductase [Actinophytocola sediminis]
MIVPVVVCGRSGRMARLIAEAVHADPQLELTARASTRPQGVRLAEVAPNRPAVVDFTAAEATVALLKQALTVPCALVVGTSGLGPDSRELLDEVGRHRPVVIAANFSLALAAMARFVRDLSDHAGTGWAAGVLDIHFAGKRDRPSGTSRFLAGQWQGADRAATEIASFRMGDGVGEHRLLAAGPGEQVEVTHRVVDRRAYLPGILRSIRFAAQASPGIYTLEDTVTPGWRDQ